MAEELKSPIIDQVKELENKETFKMDGQQAEQYKLICDRLTYARNQRSMNRDEFDGMTYEQAYLSNQRANMSYLAPKINNDDVRINTGTTEKKIEFVLNELLALNLRGEVLAYDKNDNLMDETSKTFTDLVYRTEEMERADEKDLFIYSELLSQPSVFVEELWLEKQVRGMNGKMKTIKSCERRLIQGSQIYLGDITIPGYRFQEQPYVIKYFRMNYDDAATIYGDWDRWKYIKKGSYNTLQPVPYQIYRKGGLLDQEVEGYVYICPNDNEYQIVLQGVPMFDPGEPLPWDWQGYNIIMDGLKPFHGDFAYYKSLAQASKTLQALDNEMIRNMIRKFRQAIEPPTGVPSGKVWSRDIWSPGSMVQGATKDMFSKLIDHDGVTQSEFNMFQLIESKIDEFIGRPNPAQDTPGNPTATQIVAEQKEAAKMLGLAVIACMRLESKLAIMRTKNIFSNYTKPIGQDVDPISKKVREVYARFTIQDTNIGGSQQGTKVIQFSDQSLNQDQLGAVYAQENKDAKNGNPTRYEVVNAKMMRDIDMYFHATAVPRPRDSQELEKVMLSDELTQAAQVTQMTGRPVSGDKVIEKFERVWDDKDFFEKQPTGMAPGQGQMPMPGQSPVNGIVPKSPNKPSLNSIVNPNVPTA